MSDERSITRRAPESSRWSGGGAGAAVAPMIAAIAVAVVGLSRAGDNGYWFDEAVSAAVVRRTWSGMASVLTGQEAGMMPYYIALKSWAELWPSDDGLRAFSVLGGAVAAGLLYGLARRWFDQVTAITSVVLLVTNPFFLRYLTEVRAYSWLFALGVATAWTVDLAHRTGRGRDVLVAAACVGIGVATHLLFAVFAAATIWMLSTGRGDRRLPRRPLVLGALLVMALVAPTIPAVIERSGQLDWIGGFSFDTFVGQTQNLMGDGAVSLLLLCGLVVAGLVVLREPNRAAKLSVCVVVPSVFVIAVAAISLVRPIFVARYLAPALPMLAMAAAAGYTQLARRLLSSRRSIAVPVLICCAVLVLFIVDGPFSDDATGRNDARSAVAWMSERATPDDRVAIGIESLTNIGVLHYTDRSSVRDPGRLATADDTLYPLRRPALGYIDELAGAERMFLFLEPPAPIERSLLEYAESLDVIELADFGSLRVVLLQIDTGGDS